MKKNTWFKSRHFWGGFATCAIIVATLSLIADKSLLAAGGPKRAYQYPHDPNGADQTPPTVSISAPVDGYTVDSSTPRSPGGKYGNFFLVPLKAFASDDVSLQNVASFVDGTSDGSVLDFGLGFNNYDLDWTARIPSQAGTHTITVRAWDYNGNMSEKSVSVVVPRGLK